MIELLGDIAVPEDAHQGSPLGGDLQWLAADGRPLDWKGPVNRPFLRPPVDPPQPIIAQLEVVVRREGRRVALSDAQEQVSYAQLWDGVCGLGETIAAQTQPGELVALLLPQGVLYQLALLACLAAGRPFLALDCHQPQEWLAGVLQDAAPSMLLVPESSSLTAGPARILRLGGLPAGASALWRPAVANLDAPACVTFTSGSTGRPKGIVNSQRNLLHRVNQAILAAHINAHDRLLTLAPAGTIVAVRDVLTALLAGGRMHLADPRDLGARETRDLLYTQGITILFGFPALLRSILPGHGANDAERASAALRLVRVGGDTLLRRDVDDLRAWLAPSAHIQLIYAATEAPMMQWFVDSACRGDEPRVPIGYPLPGTDLTVIDEDGHSVPAGEPGELVAAGHCVCLGCLWPGRLLAAAGRPDGRLFRTGDLVRLRPDGLLERLGRLDRQVKIRGVRVDPDGVEAVLRQHPAVRDAGVLARTRPEGDVTLVAYVSACDAGPGPAPPLLDELRGLMQKLPAAMRPAHLYRVPEIPRLPGSKLDVGALTALAALDEARARQAHAPCGGPPGQDRIARTVAKVWQDVLRVAPAGPQEDFFAAGGDSLQAMRLIAALERQLRRELSLALLGVAPTFGGLCEALRVGPADAGGALVLLKPGDGAPPLYFVHGIGGQVAELLLAARCLSYPGPVFGLQARGLRLRERPYLTVEAMAADYLRQIRAQGDCRPYHLCGYSFGGLVAFEMACQLHNAGEELGLLGLLDTRLRARRWRRPTWLASPGIFAAALPAVLRGCSAPTVKVAMAALVAAARYRPGFYPGKLTLFTPLTHDPAIPETAPAWTAHAAAVACVPIPGTHATMLTKAHAHEAAAALSRQLTLPLHACPEDSGV